MTSRIPLSSRQPCSAKVSTPASPRWPRTTLSSSSRVPRYCASCPTSPSPSRSHVVGSTSRFISASKRATRLLPTPPFPLVTRIQRLTPCDPRLQRLCFRCRVSYAMKVRGSSSPSSVASSPVLLSSCSMSSAQSLAPMTQTLDACRNAGSFELLRKRRRTVALCDRLQDEGTVLIERVLHDRRSRCGSRRSGSHGIFKRRLNCP